MLSKRLSFLLEVSVSLETAGLMEAGQMCGETARVRQEAHQS